jgi:hypothetical protein
LSVVGKRLNANATLARIHWHAPALSPARTIFPVRLVDRDSVVNTQPTLWAHQASLIVQLIHDESAKYIHFAHQPSNN